MRISDTGKKSGFPVSVPVYTGKKSGIRCRYPVSVSYRHRHRKPDFFPVPMYGRGMSGDKNLYQRQYLQYWSKRLFTNRFVCFSLLLNNLINICLGTDHIIREVSKIYRGVAQWRMCFEIDQCV